ncbi:M1 family aminopeptidase [Rheinheimera maricola]|uniref:ABC transporter permease n=1 Tax=Rheinheimera maricola TaxID=2793282 RepID=A0ABS7XD41_9GAMM|nr:M1 family aminopeptidase [Rheinheimera maricola]MBZ9613478.1 ABC transporter permease [Rheinheimera maricola]
MLQLNLLNNEWRYLRRQPLLWLALLLLPVTAYIFATGIGGIDTLADKRLQALQMTLLMFSLPLLCGALAPLVLLRDQHYSMTELILATPLSPPQRLFSRLALMFVLCAGLMLAGFMIIYFMLGREFGFQPSLLAISLWDFALLAVPACAFYTALAGCLAQRFNSSVLLYALFGCLWLGYLILASLTGAPMLAGSSIRYDWLFNAMRLLDPFGNTALIALYQHSAPQLYGDLIFYLNRLLFCLLADGLFFITLRLKPHNSAAKPWHSEISHDTNPPPAYQAVTTAPKAALQLWQLTRTALLTLLQQRLNQLFLLGWVLLMFNEVLSGINYAEPLAVLSPTSLDALNRIADDVLPLVGGLLVLLWTWQLSWRNRHTAMAELIAATPVGSGILMASHTLALTALILLLMLLGALGCLAAEWLAYSDVQLQYYPEILGKVALSLWLLGALFSVLHAICRSPLMAAAWCCGIFLMKYTPLSGKLGLTHTLWNIAGSPLQPADAFWHFEQSQSVYWPFMSFWLLLTFALLWLAAQWSHRTGSFTNPKRGKLTLSSGLLLALAVYSGVNLHLNIIAERPLMSSDLREQWRADYEQRYANWATIAQPTLTHIEAQVDIYPKQGEAAFALNYTLQNHTTQPITKLLVGNYSATVISELKLSVAHTASVDQQLGQHTLLLANAMMPGETLQLHSKLTFKQPKHWPAVMPQFVKPSFSYLRGMPLIPSIGFQMEYQLRDEQQRRQYGLAPLNLLKPSVLFATPQLTAASYDWVTLRSVVSTDSGQTPLAQGKAVRQWQQQGRNYAEYHTSTAMRNLPVWYSLAGDVLSQQHGDVRLTVYSPQLNAAAKLNMQAMQDTLDWMTQHIAPYRGSQLSLLATPDMGATGYALPQIMMINHRVGFRAEPAADAGFDQRYRRAVHETAHQWFGHDIGNGVLEDSAFLIEPLAKYIELVLLEQRYGTKAMQALVKYERERFALAVRRSSQQTPALIDATANHDLYSRATLVFAILRQQLGDAVISQALRQLWQQNAYPQTPATSMDFVRALQAQVSPHQQQLVTDLFLGTDLSLLLEDSSKP